MNSSHKHHKERPLRVLISGGGTGGHIFPALSIAQAIERCHPGSEILFVGAENRMEMERVPAAGYKIVGLPVAGFDRRHLWRNVKVLWLLWKSIRMARKIVADFQPDIAIGVGGYASGPTLKAAQRAGVPTLLQEQNSYAGVTNKLLAAKAETICVAYPDMQRYFPAQSIVMTGNPVRKAILDPGMSQHEAKEKLGFKGSEPLVLIVGGSLGAATLNEVMLSAITDGRAAAVPFQILWQTGKRYADVCVAAAASAGVKNIKAMPFISDMAIAYRAADLVVARAGAGTISEIELLGKASILVPSPNVAEDHQRHNAEALAWRGAAGLVLDADAPKLLWTEMCNLMENEQARLLLSRNALELALPDSDEKIVDCIDQIIKNHKTAQK